MPGWIRLYREIIDKSVWINSTPEQKVILITLLCMVNYQPNSWEWQGKKFIVQPGQTITSLESIAEKAGKGISVQNIRTALKRFEKLEFLTNKPTKTGRLITIVNWASYQSKDDELTDKLTVSQQRPNKDLTTIKEVKKDKERKEIKSIKEGERNNGFYIDELPDP